MIFIAAKFRVRPEFADGWAELTRPFTEAVRAEPGCLWFEWSRSLDDPQEFLLVEAFRDDEAGVAHVTSEHFQQARSDLPPHLVETPVWSTCRSRRTTGQSWGRCGSNPPANRAEHHVERLGGRRLGPAGLRRAGKTASTIRSASFLSSGSPLRKSR
jgi:quinol monooxygenase YgiN